MRGKSDDGGGVARKIAFMATLFPLSYLTVSLGLPETTVVAEVATFVLLVGAGTAAWFWRLEVARVASVLPSPRRPRPSQTAAIAFALLLVVSGVGPFAAFGGVVVEDHAGTASAATWTTNSTYTHGDIVRSVEVGSGDYLYSAGNDNSVHKVDRSSMSQVGNYTGHSDLVYDVAMGDDGYLYSVDFGGEVHKIDPSDMSQVDVYTGHTDRVTSVTFEDGHIYTSSFDNEVHKIDASTMSRTDRYTGHSSYVRTVTMGDDGYLYSGGNNGEVHQVDPSDMSQVNTYTGHSDWVTTLSYGADGYLYSGSRSSNIHRIAPSNMSQIDTYTVHTDRVQSVVLAPDGYLYSGSFDNEMHRIEPSNMSQLDTYTGHSDSVRSVTMSSDGSLYSGSNDGTVQESDSGTSVGEPVSGTVSDTDGTALENTTVEFVNASTGTTATTATTDASGAYSATVEAGTYDVTADHPDEPSKTKTVDVPSGGTTVNFTLAPPDGGKYEQTFELDDQTPDDRFSDADLRIERATDSMGPGAVVTHEDWTVISRTTFNHNDRAFAEMEDGSTYRLVLTDDYSVWDYNGFVADEDGGVFHLEPGKIANETNTTTETEVNTSSPNITLASVEDGLVIEYDGEPVDSIDYNISDGTEYVEGELDFEEPTDYYEGSFDDDILTNDTSSETDFSDWESDYEYVTSGGETYNGTAEAQSYDGLSLDTRNGTEDDGGIAAPVGGGSGGGTPTWVIGIPAVAAVGYVVLRRRGGM